MYNVDEEGFPDGWRHRASRGPALDQLRRNFWRRWLSSRWMPARWRESGLRRLLSGSSAFYLGGS